MAKAIEINEPARRAEVRDVAAPRTADNMQTHASAVSWGAIFAGAAAIAVLSLILVILGTGLGLSSISPWAGAGASAAVIGFSTVAWLTFTQLAASGFGGYIAGRLRTRWMNANGKTLASADPDEVYFRDTAHGFLAWTVATLVTAVLLTSVIGSIIGSTVSAGSSLLGGAAATATVAAAGSAIGVDAGSDTSDSDQSMAYLVDSLLRGDMNTSSTGASRSGGAAAPAQAPGSQSPAVVTSEITRILANATRTGELPAVDLQYVGKVISNRTGMSQQESEKRVKEMFAQAQERIKQAKATTRKIAEDARKATAYSVLWISISLLIGAFIASWTATIGGRKRDL